MSFFYAARLKKLTEEKEHWEAISAEQAEIIRILGKAFDLIPVRTMVGPSGATWLPSDEALAIIAYAKDRLTEWRISDR